MTAVHSDEREMSEVVRKLKSRKEREDYLRQPRPSLIDDGLHKNDASALSPLTHDKSSGART